MSAITVLIRVCCDLPSDADQLQWLLNTFFDNFVVTCPQTRISYNGLSQVTVLLAVVTCPQTRISYNLTVDDFLGVSVVTCPQTRISYNSWARVIRLGLL